MEGTNHIATRFTHIRDNFNWIQSNIYAPNGKSLKKSFWMELAAFRRIFDRESWVVMGDFNTPLLIEEKFGGSQINAKSKEDLQSFINYQALIDLDLQGASYTWLNRRKGMDLIQVRLDRYLMSNHWFFNYYCSLKALSRIGSNHFPISFVVDPLKKKKNMPFKIEKMWLSHPFFKEEIRKWWNISIFGTTMFRVAKKLREVKFNLKKWKKESFGNIFRIKYDLQMDLGEIQNKI